MKREKEGCFPDPGGITATLTRSERRRLSLPNQRRLERRPGIALSLGAKEKSGTNREGGYQKKEKKIIP